MPRRATVDGKRFWNTSLPSALAAELNGVDQEIPALEETLVGGQVTYVRLGQVLASLIEDYRTDLEGRAVVRGLRRVEGKSYAVAEPLDVEWLKARARSVGAATDVAKLLVEVASCYSPDYGVVDHPCHQWCPRWGRCQDMQRPALHSLILHLCLAYGRANLN